MMTMRMTRKRAEVAPLSMDAAQRGLVVCGWRAPLSVCLLSVPRVPALHQPAATAAQKPAEYTNDMAALPRRPASARGLSASDAMLRSERPRKALAPASSAIQFRAEGVSSERWSKEAAEQGRRGGAGGVAGGGTSALSASQLELYSALFGASEAPGWAPASDENNMRVGVGGCVAEVPPDHAQQIERAVRKAMRGAAVERQQAVAAAVEEAQKAAAAALAAAHTGVEKAKAAAEAAEAAHREAEATHQQATRAAEKEHARAVARAVERAEKTKDVAWQAVLERQRKESQVVQEAMQQEREAALRKSERSKEAAVAEVPTLDRPRA